MKEIIVKIRNLFIRGVYKFLLKPIFFRFDAEKMHDHFINVGSFLGTYGFTRWLTKVSFSYTNKPFLEQEILGIRFENPVGLTAGFDKDARMIPIMKEVGFGFTEVGSISAYPCEGNPKPRLWRLKQSKGIVVNYGLKSEGAEKVAERLHGQKFPLPVGISIAKTNSPESVTDEKAVDDYLKTFIQLQEIGNFTVLNISCPNTYGGEPFTEAGKLDLLLQKISTIKKTKPIFLKMAPDLKEQTIDGIIRVAEKYQIDGFICTNLSKDRKNPVIKEKVVPEKGSISGLPAQKSSDEMIKYIYQKTGGRFIIIGCGGIFTAEDAYRKIKLGASLLALFTGMIFEGPQVISEINQGLVKLLKEDGFKNIKEARGVSVSSLAKI